MLKRFTPSAAVVAAAVSPSAAASRRGLPLVTAGGAFIVVPQQQQQRRAFSTPTALLRQQGQQQPQLDAVEDIVLENVEETTFTGAGHTTPPKQPHQQVQQQQAVHEEEEAFIECSTFDPYARAKITNFIKRNLKKPAAAAAAAAAASSAFFATREVSEGVFRCEVPLPLPREYGLRVARGEADSAKDAETLAAMHAANILDALGFQLYTLASMQRKHAVQARATGRYAPMPEDAPRPFDTPSPPPLRRGTGVRDESEGGIWDVMLLPSHDIAAPASSASSSSSPSSAPHFSQPAGALPFLAPDHTLLSPYILDPAALHRVRMLWTASRAANPAAGGSSANDDLPVQVRQEQKPLVASDKGDGSAAAQPALYIAEILLGPYVAQGKGPDRFTATVLAAMHLELIFDAAGVPIFPYSAEKQNLHAETARAFGRSAPRHGEPPAQPGTFKVPKPLKAVRAPPPSAQPGGSSMHPAEAAADSASVGGGSGSSATLSSTGGQAWVSRHTTLLLSVPDASFRDVSAAEAAGLLAAAPSAVDELAEFLQTAGEPRSDPFLSLRMPDGRIRTSVVLPAVQGFTGNNNSNSSGNASSASSSPSAAPAVLGGLAEAANRHDSRLLCAEHALDVLNTLGVMLHPGDHAEQSAHEQRRRARGKVVASEVDCIMPMPQPLRLVGLNFTQAAPAGAPERRGATLAIDATESAQAEQHALEQRRIAAAVSSEAAAPTATAATPAAFDPNEEFIKRTQAPPHYWDLRPNTSDGFILVDAKPVAAHGVQHAIASVRNLDPSARDRIGAFAVHHGKTALDVVKTYAALTKENTVYYSTHIELPVPVAEVGARTAIGEAPDQRQSEILASMHAELILDRLGIAVIPQDAAKQRQHAESARELGRYAPLPPPVDGGAATVLDESLAVSPATPSPPPLRLRQLQALIEIPVAPISGRGGEYLQVPMELHNSPDVLDLGAVMRVHFYLRRHRRTVVLPDVYCVPDTRNSNNSLHIAVIHVPMPSRYGRRTAVGVALTRKEAETLCYMHAERIIDAMGLALFPIASMQRRHLQAKGLLDSNGNNKNARRGRKRKGGSGSSRFDDEDDKAPDPAATPSTRTTGARLRKSGPIDPEEMQQQQQQQQEQQSGDSNANASDDDDFDPNAIPTPPALRLDPNAVVRPKIVPTLPAAFFAQASLAASADGDAHAAEPKAVPAAARQRLTMWQDYVANCDVYVDQVKKFDRAARLAADCVPRTGDSLVDDALDEAEATEVQREVRNHLMTYCLKMNVEYSQNWSTVQIGTATIRKSFTRVSVPGFPHVEALGIANNKELSMRKAAHHALCLLKRLDPDYRIFETEFLIPERAGAGAGAAASSGSSSNTKLLSSAASATRGSGKRNAGPDHGSYDRISGSFTTDGKIRLVNLYTLCNGLAAPVVSHREKIDERDGRRVQYTTVEVADLNGSRIIGWAQEAGRKTNEPAAYDDLVNTLLQRVPQFGSLARLLKTHPHLDPEHIVHLEMPPEQERRLRDLLAEEEEAEMQRRQQLELLEQQQVGASASSAAVEADSAVRQHEQQDEAEAERTARQHSDALLATVDVATSSLLRRSRETAELDPQAAARLETFLRAKQQARLASAEYRERFQARRERLTIFEKHQELLDTVRASPVTVVCVSTGGGKSTQMPQFILDDAIARGEGARCSIVVTQPRRISAISIAQRVAAERLEKIGQTVGYTVRLDAKPGSNINFCTSGVLLRLLQSNPTIDHIKYLIIDEIHERDINSDFLLILLKQLITRRPDLRVVLMSATLQSELFSSFFGGAPVINVEGFCHPVREVYLDELAATVKERNLVTPSTKAFLEGKEEVATFDTAAIGDQQQQQQQPVEGSESSDLAVAQQQQQQQQPKGYGTLEAPTEIDYPLIAFAIEHARKDYDLHGGSILVFLPGWEEITRVRDMFAGSPNYYVLPLHSSVSAEDQLKCFDPPPDPATQVKLILSTNIAESGVTIDDIGCVIDAGRAKEKTYLSRRGRTSVGRKEMGTMSQLVQVLASRANVTQRRGRVGRTRPGVCMRLFSRRQFEELPAFATPEILRQPLDALCLQILALRLGDPLEFLSQALEPPPPQSIEAAMLRLFHLGAVTEHRQLSPLGLRLALLPVAPKVGKMILYGAALQCLDSALTLAACADVDPFVSQREMKDMVRQSKLDFANSTLSDPLASINAYNSWVNTKLAMSPAKVAELESSRMLSRLSLTTISKYKEQYYDILRESGFLDHAPEEVPEDGTAAAAAAAAAAATTASAVESGGTPPSAAVIPVESPAADESVADDADEALDPQSMQPYHASFPKACLSSNDFFLELSPFSRHADSLPLLKGLLCSGLFPNVALFRDKRRFRSKLQNMLHPFPASVVSKMEEADVASPFFVFDEMVKTAGDPRVFFRGITNCSVWAILLLGASGSGASHMEFRHDLNLAILDDWLVFRVTADTLELIQALKRRFLQCIERKFTDPGDADNNATLARLQRIIHGLVAAPVRPNDLTTNLWTERGELVAVDAAKLVEAMFHGEAGVVVGASLVPAAEAGEEAALLARDAVSTATLEGAAELKEDVVETAAERRQLRTGLAEDEEDA